MTSDAAKNTLDTQEDYYVLTYLCHIFVYFGENMGKASKVEKCNLFCQKIESPYSSIVLLFAAFLLLSFHAFTHI